MHDKIFIMIIEKNVENNPQTHKTFIDSEKAYVNLPREKLCEAMRSMYVEEKLITITQRLYKETKLQVKMGNRLTKPIMIIKFLKQDAAFHLHFLTYIIDLALKEDHCFKAKSIINVKTFR